MAEIPPCKSLLENLLPLEILTGVSSFGRGDLDGLTTDAGNRLSPKKRPPAAADSGGAKRHGCLGEPDPETRKIPVGLEMAAIDNFWGQSFPPDTW